MTRRQSVATPAKRRQPRGLLLAIIALLAFAGGMGWLVQSGIRKGETFCPATTGSHRRVVSRSEKPALFWVSIELYSLLGSGTLGLALWSIQEGLKSAPRSGR